jgi:hypothetical protein
MSLDTFVPNKEKLFGRERPVDDLLSILQGSRFIVVTGAEGSGKTSLVCAGLVPALQKGFKGVAGTGWKVCYANAGITPVENLSAALADGDMMSGSGKGSLEFADEIASLIRRDHSGLLNAIRHGNLAGEENLLIVIDHFEEIFQLKEKYGAGLDWNQDVSTYLSNISRAVSMPGVPVYVVLVLQSDYIPSLYNFRMIHAFIGNGLYAIPHFRQDDFVQLIKGISRQNGIIFTAEAIEYIRNELSQDIRNILNFFILLKRLNAHHPSPGMDSLRAIDEPELRRYGKLDVLLHDELDSYYSVLSDSGKRTMENLFRQITQPGEDLAMKKPQRLKEIVDIRDLDRQELIRFLDTLSRDYPGLIDIVEPFQKKVIHFMETHIADAAVINISKIHVLRNWPTLRKWIEDERRSRAFYLRLSSAASLFSQNQTGYLRPPDLDLFAIWRDEFKPKKHWTEQYNTLYDVAFEYLRASKEHYDANVERKESARKRELRKAKTIQLTFLTIGIVCFIGLLYTLRLHSQAVTAKKAATDSAQSAMLARLDAEVKAREAKLARDTAQKNMVIAVKAQKSAVEKQAEAEKAKLAMEIAVVREEDAKIEALGFMKKWKSSAEQEKKNADSARMATEREKLAKDQAANLAQFESAGKNVNTLYNMLITEEFKTKEERVKFATMVADAYVQYEKGSLAVNKRVMPDNSLYQLLTKTQYKIMEDVDNITNSKFFFMPVPTKSGLRDIDIFGAEKIAAVGDDNLIITTGIPTGTPVMYKSKLSKSRLRTVSFLDAGKVIFGNVSGEIFLYNLNTKEELKLLGKPVAEQSLNSMVVMNNTVFAIDQGKLVALSPSTGRKSELTLDRPRQLFALGSNSILVRAQDGLFLLNTATQQIEKITVEGKLPELTAVVLGNDKVFFGDESGRIFTYKVNSALNRLQLLDKWTIRAHRTRVTALQYDGQGNRLFTASMDRTSKILDLNLENLEKAEAYAVRLEGYAKWIWDFELVTYKDNNLELFSVDEKGMLMRRVPVTAMYKQLTNWLKKEKAL